MATKSKAGTSGDVPETKVEIFQIWKRNKPQSKEAALVVVLELDAHPWIITKDGGATNAKVRSWDSASRRPIKTTTYPFLKNFHKSYTFFGMGDPSALPVDSTLRSKKTGSLWRVLPSHECLLLGRLSPDGKRVTKRLNYYEVDDFWQQYEVESLAF